MLTLEEWFQLFDDSTNILLNIDMKYPDPSYWEDEYDLDLFVQRVIDLIEKYDAGKRTVVESFGIELLSRLIKASPGREFLIVEDFGNYTERKDWVD